MTAARWVAAFAGAVLVSGCVSLLPEPPPAPQIYPLRAAVTPTQGTAAPLVIAVGRPNAVQALAVLDVVWVRDGQIGYMERAVWSARMPEALQMLLAETISAQNLAAAAIRVGEGPRADYEVRWDVHAFQVEETAGRIEARLDVSARLMESGTRRIVSARPLRLAAPITDRSASVAVSALQRLAAEGAAELGQWAAQEAVRARAEVNRGANG